MIAVVDYGMGNLRSVQKALEYLGYDARVTDKRAALDDASHIVLPGVGATSDAVLRLQKKGLGEEIVRQAQTGKPFLGICLGMQLLFDKSFENGEYDCLGLVSGQVVPFDVRDEALKIPHMGWNDLQMRESALLRGLPEQTYVYFVHSYHAAHVPEEQVIATCEYGYAFVCGVAKDNIFGLQFHPEKSGNDGLMILKNFGGMK
jgi:glutamine amidotransferase